MKTDNESIFSNIYMNFLDKQISIEKEKLINEHIKIIDELKNNYYFDEDTIIELYKYCNSKKPLSVDYIVTVADSWKLNNIRTLKDLELYCEKQNKYNKIIDKISKIMKRTLTQYEETYIEKWIEEYKISEISVIGFIKECLNINEKIDNLDMIDEIISILKLK